MNKRIHHGKIGSILLFVGLETKNQTLINLGRMLMIDDIGDLKKWHSWSD